MGTRAWASLIAVLAMAEAVQACSAPSVPGSGELLVSDDAKGKRTKASEEDAPEGSSHGSSSELGQATEPGEPPPDAGRSSGDEGANDAPTQCTLDAQCNQSGRICRAGSCTKGCRSDAGCAADETCSAGQCSPIDASIECTADYECEYGTICIGAKCVDGCYTSYDCPVGQACSLGMCKATTSTTSPPPAGSTPCSSDGQCNPGADGSGQICSPQGTCVAGCHRDNQCPGTKICVGGSCR
jgi:hypothetical protein